MRLEELTTPALLVDDQVFSQNLQTMAKALPGGRLRPHVKAHKCTSLARRQMETGHSGFTCATVSEMEGMARAGLGSDLLLANEVLNASLLQNLVGLAPNAMVAVDSEQTIEVARNAGVRRVLVDVNVGLPRCGCAPADAARLAADARKRGLSVEGVMGYEGHIVGVTDLGQRRAGTEESMRMLLEAHSGVGGEIVSAGGTGTYDLNTAATEIQAGSYALMDTAYAALGLPFGQALSILSTVISSNAQWSVCDTGLKALGMDHGNPTITDHEVWFCSDEHLTFSPPEPVGSRVRVIPAHVDPTVAYHSSMNLVDGEEVIERWAVDLRGW